MKTIEEKNKMIAQFMGVKPDNTNWYRADELNKRGIPFITTDIHKGSFVLKFHTSWDWLMPVIEKCYKLDDPNSEVNGDLLLDLINKNLANLYLKLTFDAVVEFIKWYNNKTKQTILNAQQLLESLKRLYNQGHELEDLKLIFKRDKNSETLVINQIDIIDGSSVLFYHK